MYKGSARISSINNLGLKQEPTFWKIIWEIRDNFKFESNFISIELINMFPSSRGNNP